MATVLLVDDELAVLEGFKRNLRAEPYAVVTATSSAEALSILEGRDVDVVVSDERMPGLCGTELLRQVQRAFPHVVRIMLTGEATLDLAKRAVEASAPYRLLTKPVAAGELMTTIRNALKVRELMRGRST